jgi:CDP-diacylglycerol--glycerol-3-phosphate 3-phosphatidyltransferase
MSQFRIVGEGLKNGFLTAIEPIGKLLISLKIPPIAITIAGLLVSIFAGYLFHQGFFFSAGIIVILAGICDVLDGKIARETSQMSKYGALMDSTIDRYSEVFMFLGLASFFSERSPYVILLIILAVAGSFMVSYIRARAEGLGIECKIGLMQRPERMTFLAVGSILSSIPKTGNFFIILALWGIAILANITAIQRIVYLKEKMKS